MKWIGIILPLSLVFLFYVMSDEGEQEIELQITQEKVESSPDDTFAQDRASRGPAWQNQRAEKILGLGTGIDRDSGEFWENTFDSGVFII